MRRTRRSRTSRHLRPPRSSRGPAYQRSVRRSRARKAVPLSPIPHESVGDRGAGNVLSRESACHVPDRPTDDAGSKHAQAIPLSHVSPQQSGTNGRPPIMRIACARALQKSAAAVPPHVKITGLLRHRLGQGQTALDHLRQPAQASAIRALISLRTSVTGNALAGSKWSEPLVWS